MNIDTLIDNKQLGVDATVYPWERSIYRWLKGGAVGCQDRIVFY